MSFFLTLLAPFWGWIVGAIAAGGIVAGSYFKGKANERRKLETEDLRDANTIRKAGADARASLDTSPDRLRDDDGFKRK